MGHSQLFDVIVIGGGPGGSIAAKRCAEDGFKTLLIEKKRLPRDKVCTGMVMGDWARCTIEEEFGQIPGTVLADPPYLAGHRIHVAGESAQTLEWHTPLTWRRDLDYWMVQRATEAGVVVRDGLPVVRVTWQEGSCSVIYRSDGISDEIRGRFIIGADGAISVVRRSILPELKVRYAAPGRKCYRGALDIEKNLMHWFFPTGRSRPRFDVHQKNDVFLIEGRPIRQLQPEIDKTLAPYGFQPKTKPEWADGCAIALLYKELVSGKLLPALGNILLIGDAAGLILPITFEGIGSALKSGLLAADSIRKSMETGQSPASSYIESLEPIVGVIRHLSYIQKELDTMPSAGHVTAAMLDAYRATRTLQNR